MDENENKSGYGAKNPTLIGNVSLKNVLIGNPNGLSICPLNALAILAHPATFTRVVETVRRAKRMFLAIVNGRFPSTSIFLFGF